jgi:nucleotide-binding universal stress UspA family protein
MKKLLCPIDFSSDSLNALEYAAKIAEQHKASLTLIHVFTESEFGEALSKGLLSNHYKQADIDNLTQAAENVLKNLAEEVKRMRKSQGLANCDYHFTYGPLQEQLTHYARENDYDLIVMGTTGVTDVMERYIGSNTMQTIARAHCPVLIIPENADYHKIQKVVYASDYQMEDSSILNQLVSFLAPGDAEMHIVHVAQEENDIEQAMYNDYVEQTKTYLNYEKISFAIEYNQDPAHGLDAYVIRENADLLAVFYQRKNFIQKLLDESTTKDIAYFATYPVLVFKEIETPPEEDLEE